MYVARRLLRFATLLAVFASTAAPMRAQPIVQGTTRLAAGLVRGPDSTSLRKPGENATRLAAVRLTVAPGRVSVVRVPLPEPLQGSTRDSTYFSVQARPEVRLLGAASGILPRTRTSLILSFNVGRLLPAGASEIALVEFRSDSAAYEVPVEFTVTRTRAVSLTTTDASIRTSPGRWTLLRTRLINRGNAPESLTVDIAPLEGWRSARSAVVAVAPGTAADATVRVWTPPRAPLGTTVLRLLAHHGAAVVADAEARMFVTQERDVRADGLTLALSSLGVLQEGAQGPAVAYGASLTGHLSDSVTVDARVNVSPLSDAATSFALARSGMMTMPPSVMVNSPRLGVSAGVLSSVIHDPGGAFLSGFGGGGRVRLGRWQASAFGGRPFGLQQDNLFDGRGVLAGGTLARQAGAGTYGLEALHLDDREMQRGLQSVSAFAQSVTMGPGTLDLSVALRRTALPRDSIGSVPGVSGYASGSALSFATPLQIGAAGSFRVNGRNGSFEFRALHAPSGSQGFARAGSEYTLSLSRRLGWLQTSASAWHQADDNRFSGRVSSTGWFVSPSTSVRNGFLRLGLEGRGTDFTVSRGAIRYGNSEIAAGGLLELNSHGIYMRSRAFGGPQRRILGTAESSLLPATGLRMEFQNSVGVRGARGGLDATWNRITTSGAGSLVPGQDALLVRAEQLRLFSVGDRAVTFSGDAQRIRMLRSLGMASMGWMWHGGVHLPLVRGMGVTLGLDRNPFMQMTSNGRAPLLYTVRMDQQQSLGSPFGGAPTRRLFLDDDGDSRFDRGETPVAGVAVRCGDQTVTTDDKGRFACDASDAMVDIRMLPMGLVADGAAKRGDIAVYRVTPVAIALRAPSIDAARLTPAELSKAIVVAKDASGLRWYARADAAGRFVFDALPLGRYTIEVEQGALNEPLTVAGSQELWVRSTSTSSLTTVDVRGRQTRIKVIGGASQTPAPSPAPETPC